LRRGGGEHLCPMNIEVCVTWNESGRGGVERRRLTDEQRRRLTDGRRRQLVQRRQRHSFSAVGHYAVLKIRWPRRLVQCTGGGYNNNKMLG